MLPGLVGVARGEAVLVGVARGEAVLVGVARGEAVLVGVARGEAVLVGVARGEVVLPGCRPCIFGFVTYWFLALSVTGNDLGGPSLLYMMYNSQQRVNNSIVMCITQPECR